MLQDDLLRFLDLSTPVCMGLDPLLSRVQHLISALWMKGR